MFYKRQSEKIDYSADDVKKVERDEDATLVALKIEEGMQGMQLWKLEKAKK